MLMGDGSYYCRLVESTNASASLDKHPFNTGCCVLNLQRVVGVETLNLDLGIHPERCTYHN